MQVMVTSFTTSVVEIQQPMASKAPVPDVRCC